MNIFSFISEQPLLFTQLYFWIFLLIVLIGFSALQNKKKLSYIWLLLASLFFYYKSSGNFVILLIATTLITFGFASWIDKVHGKKAKKVLLFLGILIDCAFLLYFKYTYFFIDILNDYFSCNIQHKDYLALFANNTFHSKFSVDKIILPVGISFYTFQAISFLVDKYKGLFKQKVSLLDFAFYLSFFPQLVAGPIVRADVFIPQIQQERTVTKYDFSLAFFFILNGLIKKIFVADYISINFVDRVFSAPESFSAMENLLSTYAYTMQIYCDFSGYTDIAIAVSLLFGFHLPMNFNSPYKATTISDFWHRWHISLSTWLRDYIYIPLGGNRKGKFRQYINLMATMLIGGLWHGANLKFVFWGAVHGFLLVIDKLIKPFTNYLSKYKVTKFLLALITFHLVNTLWIFFRADDFNTAVTIINKILAVDISQFIPVVSEYWKPVCITFVALVVHLLPHNLKIFYKDVFCEAPLALKIVLCVVVIFILVQVKSSSIQPFIYFQF